MKNTKVNETFENILKFEDTNDYSMINNILLDLDVLKSIYEMKKKHYEKNKLLEIIKKRIPIDIKISTLQLIDMIKTNFNEKKLSRLDRDKYEEILLENSSLDFENSVYTKDSMEKIEKSISFNNSIETFLKKLNDENIYWEVSFLSTGLNYYLNEENTVCEENYIFDKIFIKDFDFSKAKKDGIIIHNFGLKPENEEIYVVCYFCKNLPIYKKVDDFKIIFLSDEALIFYVTLTEDVDINLIFTYLLNEESKKEKSKTEGGNGELKAKKRLEKLAGIERKNDVNIKESLKQSLLESLPKGKLGEKEKVLLLKIFGDREAKKIETENKLMKDYSTLLSLSKEKSKKYFGVTHETEKIKKETVKNARETLEKTFK